MQHTLDNLTQEQRKILKQFRLRLEDVLTAEDSDYALVKYLRAKNFDLKGAEKIFKENYYSRQLFDFNTILETFEKPEVAVKYEATVTIGYAKDGTLIRYLTYSRLDIYGFIMTMSSINLYAYLSYIMESDIKMMKDRSFKTGKDIQEVTYVVDFEGFKIQQLMYKSAIETGLDFMRLFQDCYPELWRRFLFVNAPKIFDKIFNLFKPVFRSAVLEQMHIADKDSSRELLLKYIDENVLPAFLGGKRVDSNGDPLCKEFIKFGGKIPETFYGQNTRVPLSLSDPGVKFLNIRPRSMGNVSTVVQDANTKMRLQIRSENGSISTSVLYREFGPDPQDTELPKEDEYLDETSDNFKYKQVSIETRFQVHCIQEDAVITLKWPGIYVIRFNNSSSWFTSRRLLVKLEQLPLSKEE